MDKRNYHGARPKDSKGNPSQTHNRRGSRNQNNHRHSHNKHNPNPNNARPAQPNQAISLGKLKSYISNNESTDVLHCLMSERSGFIDRLKLDDTSFENVHNVLAVIQKALQSTYAPETTSKLLNVLNESYFLMQNTPRFITELLAKEYLPIHYISIISDLLDVLQAIAKHLPTASMTTISYIVPLLKTIFSNFPNNFTREIAQVEAIEKSQTTVLEALRDKVIQRGNDHAQYDAPPDDFKEIAIVPTQQDVLSDEEPFLRKNNVFGSYISIDDYLDTQFRLLREDCIQPLRYGIAQLKNYLKQNQKIDHRRLDIKVYSDVKILHPIGSSRGISFRVQFCMKGLQRIKWDKTKRLLTGALVCLSRDNFTTTLIGVIADHDAKSLENGFVGVFFEGQYLQALDLNPAHVYQMVESSSYFEAYRHNLQGLQAITEENLPFAKYLINQSTQTVEAPQYIRGNDSVYDFSCIAPSAKKTMRLIGRKAVAMSSKRDVKILDEKTWPSKEEMGLDDSQYKAMKTALMKEFSVIQGPPGTGKTYIGLKIAELLLRNKEAWNKTKTPILIVCYTNHALDQFLEGILACRSEDDMIVRVGGRCESEEMQRCLLKNIKKERRVHIPRDISSAKAEIYAQMEEMDSRLKSLSVAIRSMTTGIFHEQYLQSVMLPQHYNSLLENAYHMNMAAKMKTGDRNMQIMSAMVTWLMPAWTKESDKITKNEDSNQTEELDDNDQLQEDDYDMNTERIYNLDLIHEIQSMVNKIDVEVQNYREHALTANEIKILMHDKSRKKKGKADKDGFIKVQESASDDAKRKFQMVLHYLSSNEVMSPEEAYAVTDIWKLSERNRWRLYHHWSHMYFMLKQQGSRRMYQEYNQLAERLSELHAEEDFRVLQSATVIGMTTTGAAKNRLLLQRVQPRIVIVEEAAEVLEAHIITALSAHCQHLILIGDHQQLRPNPSVYHLARNYQLDVSLFERMVKNDMHCDQLLIQHRMRPEIVSLIVPHIYKEVINHESVLSYEDVRGIASNLYFLHHEFEESGEDDTKSRSNLHEAKLCGELALYFQKQDYDPSQITILTMYTGQMFLIRNHMPPTLQRKSWLQKIDDGSLKYPPRVRVTPVDNYQGEENDIIILSLVRNNAEGKIGFLKIANRVCVALSRAKKGFYVIGNMAMLEESSNLWRNIITMLKSRGQVVTSLSLCCQNHKDTRTEVKDAIDFKNVPDGGCKEKCDARLDCGHKCTRFCHSYDQYHAEFVCKKPCQRKLCDLGHICPKVCYKECGECKVLVEKKLPDCGHLQKMHCYQDPTSFICQVPCEKKLQCDHTCQAVCGAVCTLRCNVLVMKTLPKCDHQRNVNCFQTAHLEIVPCLENCPKDLPCGHPCKNKCSTKCTERCEEIVPNREWPCGHKWTTYCYHDAENFPCRYRVTKELPCNHSKEMFCCEDPKEVQCKESCAKLLVCGHGCKNKCFDECIKECKETVKDREWPCGHKLTAKCFQNASNFPCTTKVKKVLQCGHSAILRCNQDISEAMCQESVMKELGCGHPVQMKCFEDVNKAKCEEMVVKDLECKHTVVSKCGEKITDYKCKAPVERTLPCGHEMTLECHVQGSDPKCQHKIVKKFDCGHEVHCKCSDDIPHCKKKLIIRCYQKHELSIQCYQQKDVKCEQTCGVKFKCGHKCPSKCYECKKNGHHPLCAEPCMRTQPCGHKCAHICGEPCLPCQEECKNACPHGKCDRACGEPCKPCEKPCTRRCIHARCNHECGEHCSCEPCFEPCPLKLLCGHDCSGLCGLTCPAICKFCNAADVQMMMSVQGFKLGKRNQFVMLQGCEHVIETSVLRDWIEKKEKSPDLQQLTCPICPRDLSLCGVYAESIKQRRDVIERAKIRIIQEWTAMKDLDEMVSSNKSKTLKSVVRKIFSTLTEDEMLSNWVKIIQLITMILQERNTSKMSISARVKLENMKKKLQMFDNANDGTKSDAVKTLKETMKQVTELGKCDSAKLLHQVKIIYLKACIESAIAHHFEESEIRRVGKFIYPDSLVVGSSLPLNLHKLERTPADELLLKVLEVESRIESWLPEDCSLEKGLMFHTLLNEDSEFNLSWLCHPSGSWKRCPKGHVYFDGAGEKCDGCHGINVKSPTVEKLATTVLKLRDVSPHKHTGYMMFETPQKEPSPGATLFQLGSVNMQEVRQRARKNNRPQLHHQTVLPGSNTNLSSHGAGSQDIQFRTGGFGRGRPSTSDYEHGGPRGRGQSHRSDMVGRGRGRGRGPGQANYISNSVGDFKFLNRGGLVGQMQSGYGQMPHQGHPSALGYLRGSTDSLPRALAQEDMSHAGMRRQGNRRNYQQGRGGRWNSGSQRGGGPSEGREGSNRGGSRGGGGERGGQRGGRGRSRRGGRGGGR